MERRINPGQRMEETMKETKSTSVMVNGGDDKDEHLFQIIFIV